MCTITANGDAFRPMFVLPEFVQLPDELKSFCPEAYFVSSGTGWMTQRTFLMYAHVLLYELSLYRAKLEPNLREERLLLILDGHSSRWTSEAIALLRDGGVDVLVLPAHCTHVLQPFDVCVASAVKNELAIGCNKLELSEDEYHTLRNTATTPETMGEKRAYLINAFLNAWSGGADRGNVKAGFLACGLYPLVPETAINNKYTRRLEAREHFAEPGLCLGDMNCAMVTDDNRLAILKAKPNKIFIRHPEKLEAEGRQWRELLGDPVTSGRYLGGPGGCTWYKQGLPGGTRRVLSLAERMQVALAPCHKFACQLTNRNPKQI
jgi:hypothetical protein